MEEIKEEIQPLEPKNDCASIAVTQDIKNKVMFLKIRCRAKNCNEIIKQLIEQYGNNLPNNNEKGGAK